MIVLNTTQKSLKLFEETAKELMNEVTITAKESMTQVATSIVYIYNECAEKFEKLSLNINK